MFTAEFGSGLAGCRKLLRMAAALGERQPPSCRCQWRGVLQQFGESRDSAGSHECRRISQRAAAGLFGALGVDPHVWQRQFACQFFEQARPLLQWFDQVHHRLRTDDSDDETGIAAATSDINDGLRLWSGLEGDAEEFERLGVVALNNGAGFYGGDTGVGGGGFDEGGVALKERQPTLALREIWEKARKVKPIEIQGTPRSAITRGMIQLDA